jgi:tRNA/rRNA methyltransferase
VNLDPGRVRFVLVEPQSGGNVGAAARAMKNLGFSRMALVSPTCDPLGDEARRMAVDARDVLASAVVFEALDDALRGAACVVGTSRRSGRQRRPHYRLDDFSSEILGLASAAEIAIVFGREDHGLCDLDLDLCTHLVYLPGSDDYPSFNLAQAVLLCAYELRRAALDPPREDLSDPPATHDEREAFYGHLRQALLTIGYVHGESVVPIMRRLRRMLGRATVTTEDVRMLRGLARQILWTAEQAGLPIAADEP